LFEAEEGTRERKFTGRVTFNAFLGQVMSRGSSCREAVRKVQAWYLASGQEPPGSNDSAYCQARARLGLGLLRNVFERLCGWFEGETKISDRWCGRRVKLIDCTGLSMPDTDANRAEFEYAGNQRPGCGFPTGKLLGLFDLATGHLDHFIHGNWKEHDMGMIRSVIGWIDEKDVVVADRGFCGWGVMALLIRKNVDVVFRLHQRRDSSSGLTKWVKPQRHGRWGKCLWAELPDSLAVRIVRYQVVEPGFRTKEVVLVTTLTDKKKYPDEVIIALYGRRWQIELNLRDIKTTLGLDVLRCKTPELIAKEITMQAIAYNLVRGVMFKAARLAELPLYRLSFKGTVDTLRQWASLFERTDAKTARAWWEELLFALAADPVPLRPARSEPRAVKRRPKVYQKLTTIRDRMAVSKSRRIKNKPKAPKCSLT